MPEGKLPQTLSISLPWALLVMPSPPESLANIQPLKMFLETQDLPSLGQGKLPFPSPCLTWAQVPAEHTPVFQPNRGSQLGVTDQKGSLNPEPS